MNGDDSCGCVLRSALVEQACSSAQLYRHPDLQHRSMSVTWGGNCADGNYRLGHGWENMDDEHHRPCSYTTISDPDCSSDERTRVRGHSAGTNMGCDQDLKSSLGATNATHTYNTSAVPLSNTWSAVVLC